MARNLLAPERDANKGINGLSIHSRDTCFESLAGQGIQLLPRSRPGNLDCLAQVGGVGAPSPTAPVSGSNFPNSGEFLTSALPRPNPFPTPFMQPSLLRSPSPSPQPRSLGCHRPRPQAWEASCPTPPTTPVGWDARPSRQSVRSVAPSSIA